MMSNASSAFFANPFFIMSAAARRRVLDVDPERLRQASALVVKPSISGESMLVPRLAWTEAMASLTSPMF